MVHLKKIFYGIEKRVDEDSRVTSVARISHESVVVSLANNQHSLLKLEAGKIEGTPVIKGAERYESANIDIKFVNKARDLNGVVVVPEGEFSLVHLEGHKKKPLTLNGKEQDLQEAVIKAICKSGDRCTHHGCYELVGFVEVCGFNLIVSSKCEHTGNRNLFIMQSDISRHGNLESLTLFAEVDLVRVFKNMKVKHGKHSKVAGVTVGNDNTLYVLTTYNKGRKGHVWSIPFFFGLNCFGAATLLTKLNNSPIGLTVIEGGIIAVCDKKEKLVYYSIVF